MQHHDPSSQLLFHFFLSNSRSPTAVQLRAVYHYVRIERVNFPMISSDQKLFPFLSSVSFIHRVSVYRVPVSVLREAWIATSADWSPSLIVLPRSSPLGFYGSVTRTCTHTCARVVVPRYTINHLNGVCRREITANLVQSRMLRVLYESTMGNMKQRILQTRSVIRTQFGVPLIHWLHDCVCKC